MVEETKTTTKYVTEEDEDSDQVFADLQSKLGSKFVASKGQEMPETRAEEPAPTPVSASKFQKQALDHHNQLRAKHKVPALILDQKVHTIKILLVNPTSQLPMMLQLCEFAQEWADKLAQSGTFRHRSNNKYGENLYTEWSSKPKDQEVCVECVIVIEN